MSANTWDQQAWVDIIPPVETTTIEPIYLILFAATIAITAILFYMLNKPKNRALIKLNFICRRFLHGKITSKQACVEVTHLLHSAGKAKQGSDAFKENDPRWSLFMERLYCYSYSKLLPDKKETMQVFQETNKWLKNL